MPVQSRMRPSGFRMEYIVQWMISLGAVLAPMSASAQDFISTGSFANGTCGPCEFDRMEDALANRGGNTLICVSADAAAHSGTAFQLIGLSAGDTIRVYAADETCENPLPLGTSTTQWPDLDLDGLGMGQIPTGADVTLRQLKLVDGGSGTLSNTPLWVRNGASLVLDSTRIRDSTGTAVLVDGELEMNGFSRVTGGSGGGAAIHVSSSGYAELLDATFIGSNTTTASGAGVFVAGGVLVMRDQVNVSNNTAAGDGGGIMVRSSTSVVDIDGFGVSIDWNSADRGGGIFIEAADRVELTNLELQGNDATTAGGGLYTMSNHLTLDIDDLRAEANEAPEGAVIWSQASTLDIDGADIQWTRDGQSIYLLGGTLDLVDARLANSTGGIYATNGATVTLGDFEASGHFTRPAIEIDDATLTLEAPLGCGLTFADPCNELFANEKGAIRIVDGEATISRTVLRDNAPFESSEGSAVHVSGAGTDVNIDNAVIRTNSGTFALKNDGAEVNIASSTLYGNADRPMAYVNGASGTLTNTIWQGNNRAPRVATQSSLVLDCVRGGWSKDGTQTISRSNSTTALVQFMSAPTDLRLDPSDTAALDTCATGVRPDMMGRSESGAFDKGAYELQ